MSDTITETATIAMLEARITAMEAVMEMAAGGVESNLDRIQHTQEAVTGLLSSARASALCHGSAEARISALEDAAK